VVVGVDVMVVVGEVVAVLRLFLQSANDEFEYIVTA
jgi:hypothetical protein